MSVTHSESVTAFEAGDTRARQGFFASLWSNKALLRRILMIGGVVLAVAVATYFYLTGGRYIGSDDSYIHANKLMVSTDVSGLIATVNVKEGQHVRKGQVLFTLDEQPFRIALDNAQAALAQTVMDTESTRATYRAALGQAQAQAAQVNLNRTTYDRYASLAKQNAIAATTVDTARGAVQTSQATLLALHQTAATSLAKLNGDPNLPAEKTPAYLKAKAAVDEMQRQLDHAVVRAPFDGIVGEVDSLQPGTLVISAMSAFTTTSAVGLIGNNVWIESDMKETDLTHVRDGDPVSITIDTYPGRKWTGHVESISAGSDSSFSALPAENASGNWVKVVQRIPVRIAIDQKPGDPQLRAGMSVIISIDTGHRRWWRLLNS